MARIILYTICMIHDHKLTSSFRNAFRGLSDSVKKESNLKIHLCMGVLAIILGLVLGLTTIEWAVLVLAITMIFILELVNTALETLVDMVSPEIRESARIAKDVAAGSVLLGAMASVIIGALLFLPKILTLLAV